MNRQKGQIATEFALTLPFICIGIGTLFFLGLLCVLSQMRSYGAHMKYRAGDIECTAGSNEVCR